VLCKRYRCRYPAPVHDAIDTGNDAGGDENDYPGTFLALAIHQFGYAGALDVVHP